MSQAAVRSGKQTQDRDVSGLVEKLFRHEAGRLTAALVASLGASSLQLAEEVVQEALIQALKHWPFRGVPDKPAAWLYRVARNLALDRLRRDSNFLGKKTVIQERLDHHVPPQEAYLDGEITDDQLRLVFLCCHPELPRDARVGLTLKLVGGFGASEIARAFFTKRATIAQRLVRAQKKLRERDLQLEMPSPEELPERLDAVLEALYLMFNEGYVAHQGDELVRADLCAESLRLIEHLTDISKLRSPAVHALSALMHFQASRLHTRLDAEGELISLAEQSRQLWDRRLIGQAFRQLDLAAMGENLTVYHLEAGIASFHAIAPSFEETDWSGILSLYDELCTLAPSPIVELNRAVAVSRVHGLLPAIDCLDRLAHEDTLVSYYLFHATRGDLLCRLGDRLAAAEAFRRALECPCTEPERRFLERSLRKVDTTARVEAPH